MIYLDENYMAYAHQSEGTTLMSGEDTDTDVDISSDTSQTARTWFKPLYSHLVFAHGSMGRGTEEIQTALNILGYELNIDSRFGPLTEVAVIEFQKAHRLEADGVVGKDTWKVLFDAVNAK